MSDEQSDLLEEYLSNPAPDADANDRLDSTLALIIDALRSPGPQKRFLEDLERQLFLLESQPDRPITPLVAALATPKAVSRVRRLARPLGFAFGAMAVVALLSILIVKLAWTNTPNASALELLSRAAAQMEAPSAEPIGPFTMTARYSNNFSRTVIEVRRWVSPPNRWRSEADAVTYSADGAEVSRVRSWTLVSDGTTEWQSSGDGTDVVASPVSTYDAELNTTFGPTSVGVPLDNTGSLASLFADAAHCFDPHLVGSDSVVGRPTYVIDLGVDRCAPTISPSGAWARVLEPTRVWIDQKTFAVTKWVAAPRGTEATASYQVTSLTVGVGLDPGIFESPSPTP